QAPGQVSAEDFAKAQGEIKVLLDERQRKQLELNEAEALVELASLRRGQAGPSQSRIAPEKAVRPPTLERRIDQMERKLDLILDRLDRPERGNDPQPDGDP